MAAGPVATPSGAYTALGSLTLMWGLNWAAMKLALARADPVVYNAERTWIAVLALFAVIVARRGSFWPQSWIAVLVTGFFQTTVNFGATTMAVAGGGAGRAAVLVFTMPFWTLLIAWPVLGERVRGLQWLAVACAFAGLTAVVAPWNLEGALAPKLWAILSGFGWAAGTVAAKYFQRSRGLDMTNFMAWQMLLGALPLAALAFALPPQAPRWDATYAALMFYTSLVSTAGGFLLWIAVLKVLPAGTAALNMFAIPVIALVSSMFLFGERLAPNEWAGIALIGAGLAIVALRAWREVRAR